MAMEFGKLNFAVGFRCGRCHSFWPAKGAKCSPQDDPQTLGLLRLSNHCNHSVPGVYPVYGELHL